MRASAFLRIIAVLVFAGAIGVAHGQSTLIPLTTRRDMVFDHAGKFLYITTTDGSVRSYNLATGQLGAGYNLGGSLNGLDIAADDSFLLIAQGVTSGSQGMFHRLDLQSGAVTNIVYSTGTFFAEGGGWDVAIASNGLAFVTTQFSGSGATPLRQIDLATNSLSVRSDAPGSDPTHEVSGSTQIYRSADRSRLYFLEPNRSDGPVFTYDATTNTFGSSARAGMYFSLASAAVNRNGTLLATLVGIQSALTLSQVRVALDNASDLKFVRGINGPDSGMAFDAVSDTFYAVSSTSGQIIAYDTTTFREKYRLNIGETITSGAFQFGPGTLVASQDGRYLALATASGIRVFSLTNTTPAPGPTPTLSTRRDIVFDHSGRFAYITTSTGLVERYDLATGALQIIADLGGALNGADISPDDSFLLIAQANMGVANGVVHRLDLATGAVTNLQFARRYPESGSWDVAIGSKGRAFFTTSNFAGFSGTSSLRQINLTTNAVAIRTDAPGFFSPSPAVNYRQIMQDTHIHRSADASLLYFLGSNVDAGPIFTYNAITDTFGPSAQAGDFLDLASAAVNRNGSLLATRFGYPNNASLDTAPGFDVVRTLPIDGGVAFDAVTDTLYGVDTARDQIVAFDTTLLTEKYRLDIGENISGKATPFGTGTLVASNDGHYLALETPTGIRFFALASPPPAGSPDPLPVFGYPRDMVFDHAGRYLYVTTAGGQVWPFNLLTNKTEAPYNVGGSLGGVDIAADDSYLLLGQTKVGLTQGVLQKLSLSDGKVTNLIIPRHTGSWDVAIASNGLALFTGVGGGPIHQFDPASNTITARSDSPTTYGDGVYPSTPIQRSADGTGLCFLEYGVSSRFVYTYDAPSNTFQPKGQFQASPSAAVNRDGSLLANFRTNPANGSLDDHVSLTSLSDYSFIHRFAELDNAVAFDAVRNVLYGVNATAKQIIGYDTQSFSETIRIPIGDDVLEPLFGRGPLVSSSNGRYLAYVAKSALRIYDLATGSSTSLSTLPNFGNISTRAIVGTGDNVPIAGFIITGTDAKRIVIRGIGPSLAAAGVASPLSNPTLELHDQAGNVIAFNDDWRDSQATAIEGSGLAPTDLREAVIIATLPPATYTAVLRGQGDTVGTSVIELYDVDPKPSSKLANISTRGNITGNDVMIAGVIVRVAELAPSDSLPPVTTEVVVRGLGPSLKKLNVANALPNPRLELYDANGFQLRSNNDWFASDLQGTGLELTDKLEAAIRVTLFPGSYTAILRGENNTVGVGVVEVYSLR
jgi:WD40 repeat protein